MKKYSKIIAMLLVVLFVIYGGISYEVSASSKKILKPKVSVKVYQGKNYAKIIIDKTEGASWYTIEMKAEKDSKFTRIKKIKKDGTIKRSYTKKNLPDGKYSFRVRAYAKNGNKTIKSSYSKTISVIIGENKYESDFKLPEGTSSEYKLYLKVLNYLNNGFHIEDIENVYDEALTTAFYYKPKYLYDYEFDLDELCSLVNSIRKKSIEFGYGPIKDESEKVKINYDEFRKLFPDKIQSRIDSDSSDYERFIEKIVSYSYLNPDINPFATKQRKWDKIAEKDLSVIENDDKDFNKNFSKVYDVALGNYVQNNENYEMTFHYTKLNGRFYLLGFSYAIGVYDIG